MQAASKAVADIKTTLVRPVTYQSYAGRLFYLFLLSMYVSNAKINIANSNINESVWKTLIDCETFLKIIPCSHGPHLTREKTATALKTSCSIHYTGKLKINQEQ